MKYRILAGLAFVAGCTDVAAVKDAARESLIDPSSAQFGEITIIDTPKGRGACVTTNAKNRFGGFTGDQQIIVRQNTEGDWEADGAVDLPHETCVNVFLDTFDEPGQ